MAAGRQASTRFLFLPAFHISTNPSAIPAWFGLIAPANLPADIQNKLHAAAVKVLAMPEVKAKLEKLGATPVGDTPAHFAAQIKSEVAKNKRVAAAAKISLD